MMLSNELCQNISTFDRFLCKSYGYLEKLFWVISAILMIIASFVMLYKGAMHFFADTANLKMALTKDFFYAFICLELFQISRVRIEGESHKKVLYHFIVMAALTFGREIFLVHNITLPVVTGFIMMIVIFMAFYTWRAAFSNPAV